MNTCTRRIRKNMQPFLGMSIGGQKKLFDENRPGDENSRDSVLYYLPLDADRWGGG
jgi:hypothetical protein